MKNNSNSSLDDSDIKINSSPVFVIGSARSGTSILSQLIRDYLKVSFGTESQFIIRFYRQLPQYGNLKLDRNMRRLLADIGKERCFRRWVKFGYTFDKERIFSRIQNRSYSGLLHAIFSDLAIHNGMNQWGDKTPEYINDLEILYKLFPNARFVHILRDGRDVALSTFKMHFGAKNIGVAALQWNRQMQCVADFKKVVDPNQFIEIKYENFLEDPIQVFSTIFTFLRIKDENGKIRKNIETKLSHELFRDNYFKWKKKLSHKEKLIYEKVNYDLLEKNGYETITDGKIKIGSLEKLSWILDHRIRQLARLDTWKDNFYKLILRSKEYLKAMNN